MRLIWHTVMWAIWSATNNVIFNNGGIEVEDVVEDIKNVIVEFEFIEAENSTVFVL
jgi:hypothetical protein